MKKTAAENALALIVRRMGALKSNETSGVSRLKKLGLSHGVAQRLVADGEDVNVSALDTLAQGLHVQPWQLLVPRLDPDALPELHAPSSLFSSDIVERLAAATAVERLRAENAVRAALDMPLVQGDEGFRKTTLPKSGAQKSSPGKAKPGNSDRQEKAA